MAVYTKINAKDISSLSSKFNIGKVIKFQGIKQGIENTNYFLKTKKNKYILTIFEKRVQKKDLPFFMKLMDKLNGQKINCPKPLKDKNGKYLTQIKKKTACIVTFLDGKDKQTLNAKNCYEVGKNIARFHKASNKTKLYRKNSMSINNLDPLLKSINFKSNVINSNLKIVLKNNLKEIKRNWPTNLPQGIIHGDLFIDNIFFKKNKLSGIIDFYFAANDYFMYEIAICINALCFDKINSKFKINKRKIRNLIKGYESTKKISLKEKKSLNILCRGAAMRYFLTRLYDYTNTPKTAFINIKDPREYYQKIIIHNNLKTYKDYLN